MLYSLAVVRMFSERARYDKTWALNSFEYRFFLLFKGKTCSYFLCNDIHLRFNLQHKENHRVHIFLLRIATLGSVLSHQCKRTAFIYDKCKRCTRFKSTSDVD